MKPWIAPAVLTVLGVAGVAMLLQNPAETVIGEYATTLDGRSKAQRHNAVRSLREIQGIVIAPGATFSFNQRLKGWTQDMGYRLAPVSYNGQLVDAWGGGVCQTSTTLYNAALLAGMEIVERNPHRFAPSYVPPGRDAAVAYKTIDLRFKNPFPFPVRIQTRVQAQSLYVSLVGSGGKLPAVSVYSDVREVRDPRSYQVQGSRARVRNTGKEGFDVVVWREIAGRRELVSQDDYPAMNRIVEVR